MIELTFDQLITRLVTFQTAIAGAQKDALEAAAAELVEKVKANLPDNETGDIIRDHLRVSIDRDAVTVGVVDALVEIPGRKELFDVGQAAEDLEFGTIGSPPQSCLAKAAFTHGAAIAMRIGADIGAALAGLPSRKWRSRAEVRIVCGRIFDGVGRLVRSLAYRWVVGQSTLIRGNDEMDAKIRDFVLRRRHSGREAIAAFISAFAADDRDTVLEASRRRGNLGCLPNAMRAVCKTTPSSNMREFFLTHWQKSGDLRRGAGSDIEPIDAPRLLLPPHRDRLCRCTEARGRGTASVEAMECPGRLTWWSSGASLEGRLTIEHREEASYRR